MTRPIIVLHEPHAELRRLLAERIRGAADVTLRVPASPNELTPASRDAALVLVDGDAPGLASRLGAVAEDVPIVVTTSGDVGVARAVARAIGADAAVSKEDAPAHVRQWLAGGRPPGSRDPGSGPAAPGTPR